MNEEMEIRFNTDSSEVEIEAIEISEAQYNLLSRLVGKLSLNDLKERGFSDEECQEISSWYRRS